MVALDQHFQRWVPQGLEILYNKNFYGQTLTFKLNFKLHIRTLKTLWSPAVKKTLFVESCVGHFPNREVSFFFFLPPFFLLLSVPTFSLRLSFSPLPPSLLLYFLLPPFFLIFPLPFPASLSPSLPSQLPRTPLQSGGALTKTYSECLNNPTQSLI